MSIRWLTVFLDFPAGSFDAGVAFWREVTGYGLSAARGAHGEFATLQPSAGDAYLRVQRIRDGAGGCHLDLHVDTETASLDTVARRAQEAGALVRNAEPGLVVAESPGGFLFCLTRWDGERVVPPPLGAAAGVAGVGGGRSEASAADGGRTADGPDAGDGRRTADGADTGDGVSRVDTLCLDVPPGGFEREVAFWAGLTGLAARPAPVPGYAALPRRADWPVRLLFQQRESDAPGDRTRGHLDFGCTDPGARDRHVALGGQVSATLEHWTVLADPAGREYCLCGRAPA